MKLHITLSLAFIISFIFYIETKANSPHGGRGVNIARKPDDPYHRFDKWMQRIVDALTAELRNETIQIGQQLEPHYVALAAKNVDISHGPRYPREKRRRLQQQLDYEEDDYIEGWL